MITDLNGAQSDPFSQKVFDVCICGAGVAGITLALNLSPKLDILLLEAGGFERSEESQSLYGGDSIGRDYADLTTGRLRYFGGTSNHWGGECTRLDDHDFLPKPYLLHSGWPIRRTDLDPYLERAETIVDLEDVGNWTTATDYFEKALTASDDFVSTRHKMSAPTRFAEKCRKDIERRKNISCYLHANVADLRLTSDLSTLESFQVQDYAGNAFNTRARMFVLATGGLENPRLLLNAYRQIPLGIGNQHGLVGSFFSDHLYAKVADLILEDHVQDHVESNPFGQSFKGRLKDQICESEWMLGAVEKLRGVRPDCLSLVPHYFAPTIQLLQRGRLANFLLRLHVRTPGHGQELDGKLFIGSEQTLNPLSRITLGSSVDSFGLRKIDLDWQLSSVDTQTIRQATIRFGEVFADLDLGRLKLSEWLIPETPEFEGDYGHHHMCTTRMADRPEDGVVDANQKVFGTENLYLAGSSVFSTGGYANPTLTIVQMTLRLADHINRLPKG